MFESHRKTNLNGASTNGVYHYPATPSTHYTISNGPNASSIDAMSTPRTTFHSAHTTLASGDLNGDFYTLAPSPSPPPQLPLRQRIIGAWRLESYVAFPTPSCRIQRPTFPMTKNVTGLIMYTPDGYMSAHMLIPGQQSFKRGEGEEAQWAEAGKRAFCYAGPYYISNEGSGREEVLRHTFQVCNLPGWIGDIQIRTWQFEEDDTVLVLGSEEPTEIKERFLLTCIALLTVLCDRQGDQRIPVLKWRRVRDNSNGSPPPPMPQIKVSGPGEP
ncbi:hypothetical protein MBLNU459_g7937t1 [Dothideomycetes sp. NU459]